MSFNSPVFLLFLLVVFSVTFVLRRHSRATELFLLSASYFFYASWDWRFCGLIAFSTVLDFLVGSAMVRAESRRAQTLYLSFSICTNLGLLAFFKYSQFFVDSAYSIFPLLGFQSPPPDLAIILPVGISFYTFQTLSYTIDLYRGEITAERSLLRFACFVAFFPQLVAGPIVRAAEFLPQLHRGGQVTNARFKSGLFLILRGMIKKVIFADLLAALCVDDCFSNPSQFSALALYLALVGYAFQIYNDFSGYSDIAIGVSKMLGFDLPINFNAPYCAYSLSDFWSRWHISLSTWLRDYLYIPLGGSRNQRVSTTFRNLMITMLLGGLWHGAAWNFVIWGFYHGLGLIVTHAWLLLIRRSFSKSLVNRLFTFHFVLFGWLLFRVDTIQDLTLYLRGFLRSTGTLNWPAGTVAFIGIVAASHFAEALYSKRAEGVWVRTAPVIQGVVLAVVLLALMAASLDNPAFIYFQF